MVNVNSLCSANSPSALQGLSLKKTESSAVTNPLSFKASRLHNAVAGSPLVNFNATLNENEKKMYAELVAMLAKADPKDLHFLPGDVSATKKLDALLRSGKLLNRDSNDNSSTLESLYKIATTQRLSALSNVKLLGETVAALYKPEIITQNFGDFPQAYKSSVLFSPDTPPELKEQPSLLDVETSGTCVSASLEFHLANRHPAEFARWAEGLSSEKGSVHQKVKLSSLNKNPMDAIWLLDAFELRPTKFSFVAPEFELKPDKNALKRALVQQDCWDPGERSVIDTLLQSTFMQIGSQQSYDSLTDIRGGKFNSSPQGLVEFEKTFVESILGNKEIFSLTYQNVSPEQVFQGYKCDLGVIEKHITQAVNDGEDVIVGYILTDANGKIETGHEITIVDVKKDKDGKNIFVCNDTDDDNPNLIEYSASYLLPKIHHASYSEKIAKDDLHYLSAA